MQRGKTSGVISVFVALILTSILSLGTLCIEAARYQAARTQLADAAISASTSMIASYDQNLFDRFGFLAIDTSRFTQERAIDYMEYNSDSVSATGSEKISRLYTLENIKADCVYNLTYPSLLKRQMLTRAKYRIVPQDYTLNYYNMTYFIDDFEEKCDFVVNKVNSCYSVQGSASQNSADTIAAIKALSETFTETNKFKFYNEKYNATISGSEVSLLPSVTGTVESNIDGSDESSVSTLFANANSVLGSSSGLLSSTGNGNGSYAGETDVSYYGNINFNELFTNFGKDIAANSGSNTYLSARATDTLKIAQSMKACFNTLSADSETNLLLNTYIAEFFSNRSRLVEGYMGPASNANNSASMTFVSSCAEYVFSGSSSEKTNQEKSADYIVEFLYVNNLYKLLKTYPEKFNSRYTIGAGMLWAYYESLCDYMLMSNYACNVPMDKTKMILDYGNPAAVKNAFASKDIGSALKTLGLYNENTKVYAVAGENALRYTDAIAISLWFVPNSEKIMRTADLVQLEMRYRQKYVDKISVDFLMSEENTYCRLSATAKLNSLLPVLSSTNSSGMNGLTFGTVKYSGY